MNRIDMAHLTSAHSLTDNRIRRKECAGLVERGYSVALIGPGNSADDDRLDDGVQEIKFRPAGGNSRVRRALIGNARILAEILRLRPMAVHAHDPELIPLLAFLRVVRPGIAVIYDSHEDLRAQIVGKSYIPRWAAPIVRAATGVLLWLVENIVGNIVAATPAIARTFPNAKAICTVQNFPLLREYPQPEDIQDFSTVVYSGRLTAIRGSAQIVDALKGMNGNVTLNVAGPVDSITDRLIQDNPSIINHIGVIPPGDVPQFISNGFAGLVLFQPHPNHTESQPTKLFEYMAAGRPFIASNYQHWIDLMGGRECGLFVDPAEPDQIRCAIRELSSDPEKCRRMGQVGRQLLETKFTFNAELDVLEQFVRKLGCLPGGGVDSDEEHRK